MIDGFRLLALAMALFAGAVAMAGGVNSQSHRGSESLAVGEMVMVVSGIWLVVELIRSYSEKK
jgi:hypothetical protein